MAGRSFARYLAPLAIVAFLVALMVIVTSPAGDAVEEREAATPARSSEETPRPVNEEQSRRRSGPRIYRVVAGDTPSTIAEKTGVTLEQLQELNPEIDPQQLSPGQRLRLRR